MLQRGDEREADRLPLDGRVRGIGHRLDPRHLGKHVEVLDDRLLRRPEIHRARAPLSGVQHVQADVRRDAVEPRAQRRAPLEVVEAAPRAHERLLHRVLGLERRAEHAVAVRGQLGAVLLELRLTGADGLLHSAHRTYDRPASENSSCESYGSADASSRRQRPA